MKLGQPVSRLADPVATMREPEAVGQNGERHVAGLASIGKRRGPVALGQPLPIGPEHERNMGVAGNGGAQEASQHDLSWRGVSKVSAAEEEASPLRAREQPGEPGGAQAPQGQRTGR